MRSLIATLSALTTAAAVVVAVLGLAGANPSAYYWPPLIVGVAGVAIGLWLAIRRDLRALPVLLATLVAVMAIAIASKHNTMTGIVVLAVFALWTLVWIPAGTRSRRFSTSIVIARDAASVFAITSDLRNWSRYMPEIYSVKKLTDGAVGRGTQFDVRMRVGSVSFREVDEVVEYRAPTEFSWRSTDETGLAAETLLLASNGQSTTVTHSVASEESYTLALIGVAVVNPLLKWAGMRDRRRNLVRLKQLLESSHDL